MAEKLIKNTLQNNHICKILHVFFPVMKLAGQQNEFLRMTQERRETLWRLLINMLLHNFLLSSSVGNQENGR